MKTRMYRGITPEVKQAVKEMALAWRISQSPLAELIFQAALEAVEKGQLVLGPEILPRRMTLFPPGEAPGWSYDPEGKKAEPPEEEVKLPPRAWRSTASYQISESTHQQLKDMAKQSAVGTGHLAAYFLKWGVQAYENGQLRLVSSNAK